MHHEVPRMLRPLPSFVALALLVALAPAQTVPTGFVVDTLTSSHSTPNDHCMLPDGRVLVANSAGSVQVWAGGAAVTVGNVPNVESGGERGLLSIEPHPAFAQNGDLFVYYSSTLDSFMHVDRFTCTGDLANPTSTNLAFAASSRRVVLAQIPDQAGNHNGGSLRFGPDGMLYLTIGDDANACSAQSLTTQSGCLLRMDVSALPPGGGTAVPTFASLDPGTNPLSANTDFSQLVLAHGLRNPFRMEIDQLTGNLYIADVGAGSWEEYSEYVRPAAGALPLVNFGWPWLEGNASLMSCGGTQPSGMVPPIAVVGHGAGWASIMAGPRYRNQGGAFDFGAAYEGDAFFTDYSAGQLRRITWNGTAWVAAAAVPGQPNATDWGTGFSSLTSLRQGRDGALYFTQHPSSLKRIRKLGPTNSVVAVSGTGQVGPANEPFAQPVVVQVLDTASQPLPNGVVNFAVSGPGVLLTTNPVIADPNGFAQTNVTATNAGGAITVTASTPGGTTNATASLFSRKISVLGTQTLVVLTITNRSTAVPPTVPFIVFAALPGTPVWASPIGPVCTNPAAAGTFVIEDSTGIFGGISLSGTGAIGSPSVTKVYNIPAGVLLGVTLQFQAIGFDPAAGVFRTNCETRVF
jgi:glucose/arabinose dehydrogenase